MFQKHLSSPRGECAWCYPDLTGSMKGDYCGKQGASCWYFQTKACLTGRRERWLENQAGWGRKDRKCWDEHPQSIDILESLTPVFWAATIHPVLLVFVCSLDTYSLGGGLTQPAWEPVLLCHCPGSAPGAGAGPSLLCEIWMAATVFLSIVC